MYGEKETGAGTKYTVIKVLTIMVVIALDAYLLVIGIHPIIVLFPTIILGILIWEAFLSEVGMTAITMEEDMFYFKKRAKGFHFNDLKSIDLIFSEKGSLTGKSHKTHTVKVQLQLRFNENRRHVNINAEFQKTSIWKIVEACRAHNESGLMGIRIGDEIPDNYEDYSRLLNKWRTYDSDIKRYILEKYADRVATKRGISKSEAEEYVYMTEYKYRRRMAVLGISVILLIFGAAFLGG